VVTPIMPGKDEHPPLSSVFFFFSSRRRHTRWPRDWSSDVCSSDLDVFRLLLGALSLGALAAVGTAYALIVPGVIEDLVRGNIHRSEERRVGKECRSRGGPE